MSIKRQVQVGDNKYEIEARLWEKHGKRIVYFNQTVHFKDRLPAQVGSFDLDKDEWKNLTGHSLWPSALEAVFADILELEVQESAAIEEPGAPMTSLAIDLGLYLQKQPEMLPEALAIYEQVQKALDGRRCYSDWFIEEELAKIAYADENATIEAMIRVRGLYYLREEALAGKGK